MDAGKPVDAPLAGIYRRMVRLALPIVGQNLVTYGVTLADNLMIGRLGEAAINGLFMAAIVQFVLSMLLFGVGSAMTVLCAQYWGRRDTGRIKTIVAICLRGALAIAVAVFAAAFLCPRQILGILTDSAPAIDTGAAYLRVVSVSYLFFGGTTILVSAMRTVEVVSIGLVNSLAALGVNVALNYALIFGNWGAPALGVEGAAWATVVSRLAEFAIALVFVLRIDTRLRFRPRDFLRRDRALFRDLVRYGTPLMLGQIVWVVNKFSMRAIVGHFDASSSAAVSVAENLDGLLWTGTVGLASAMGILTGTLIGAGAGLATIRSYARRMQGVFAAIGAASFLIVLFAGDFFVSFYTLEPETVDAARVFLLVLAFSVMGRAYQAPCLMGLVKAGGDTSFVFKNDAFWVFCWVLPGALLARFVFHAPDWAVYAILLSDQVAKCFVAAVKINRFTWIRNLTRAS